MELLVSNCKHSQTLALSSEEGHFHDGQARKDMHFHERQARNSLCILLRLHLFFFNFLLLYASSCARRRIKYYRGHFVYTHSYIFPFETAKVTAFSIYLMTMSTTKLLLLALICHCVLTVHGMNSYSCLSHVSGRC